MKKTLIAFLLGTALGCAAMTSAPPPEIASREPIVPTSPRVSAGSPPVEWTIAPLDETFPDPASALAANSQAGARHRFEY